LLALAHGDYQPPRGAVDAAQNGFQLLHVGRGGAYDQLPVHPAQRAILVQQRPQHGQHFLHRAMLQRNHLDSTLLPPGKGDRQQQRQQANVQGLHVIFSDRH
jgi:hypothetical protein